MNKKKCFIFIRNIVFLSLMISCFVLYSVDVEFPLIQSMSHFPYSDNHTIGKKDYTLSLNMFYSNIYMYDYERTTINDMEMWSNILAFRYGFSNRFTLELYCRALLVYGGIMDKFIENFHSIFGWSESGRYDFPRNIVNYRYKDSFSYEKKTTAQSPLLLGILGNLYKARNFQINGRVALGLPFTSKPGFSSSKPFYTFGFILLYKRGTLSIDFSIHLSSFSTPTWLADEDIKNKIFLSEFKVSYKKIFGGLLSRTTPFKSADLSNDAFQIYLGFKFWKRFEFSLIEEFKSMDTTTDVTFNLKIHLLRGKFKRL